MPYRKVHGGHRESKINFVKVYTCVNVAVICISTLTKINMATTHCRLSFLHAVPTQQFYFPWFYPCFYGESSTQRTVIGYFLLLDLLFNFLRHLEVVCYCI